MTYAGTTSTFAGQLPLEAAGSYQIEVLAMDPVNANFGLTRRSVTVEP